MSETKTEVETRDFSLQEIADLLRGRISPQLQAFLLDQPVTSEDCVLQHAACITGLRKQNLGLLRAITPRSSAKDVQRLMSQQASKTGHKLSVSRISALAAASTR